MCKYRLAVVAVLPLVLSGCGGNSAVPSVQTAATQPWLTVNDFLYQLQNLNLTKAGASKFDLVVMDNSRDGSGPLDYTPAQISSLRNSPGGPKVLLAYMSIGEAEDYRFYWKSWWKPGSPSWLMGTDPDWPGNYPVRYWDARWQKIIFGSPAAYLDRILAQGFDGVYLDLVDGYWNFPHRPTARQEMIDFVKAISAYAKSKRPGFKIVPQNAAELVQDPAYLAAIDGNGQEELSYGYNTVDEAVTPPAVQKQMLTNLDKVVAAGKLVLVVDYTRVQARIDKAYALSKAHGYVEYCTVRDLDQLIINAGHAPD